jgi:hypothetical protein
MPRDVDYIIGGFNTLGSGLQGLAQQEEERRKEREGRAEKLHQELRPLPPEQADIYRELVTRLKRGEDPQRVAIEVRARRQGLLGGGGQMPPNRMPNAQGPGGMSIPMMQPPDMTQEPEPYPEPAPMVGQMSQGTPPAQRTPTMRDLGSLQQLTTLANKGGLTADDAWKEELARARLEESRLSRGQRRDLYELGHGARVRGLDQRDRSLGQTDWALSQRAEEHDFREGMAYNKLAGDAPFVVQRLRTLVAQAPTRGPGAEDYIARQFGAVMGGRLGVLTSVVADAALTQDERNFRREVDQAVQGYRRGEFGSQVTGYEMAIVDVLAGKQLSIEDTIAALTALERLTNYRLGRAQETVPEAAQRIESGTEALNRQGGPRIAPLPAPLPNPSAAPQAAQSPLSTLPGAGKTIMGYRPHKTRPGVWRPVYADGSMGPETTDVPDSVRR